MKTPTPSPNDSPFKNFHGRAESLELAFGHESTFSPGCRPPEQSNLSSQHLSLENWLLSSKQSHLSSVTERLHLKLLTFVCWYSKMIVKVVFALKGTLCVCVCVCSHSSCWAASLPQLQFSPGFLNMLPSPCPPARCDNSFQLLLVSEIDQLMASPSFLPIPL